MKKVLFGCIAAGLAAGGAYFLYKKWKNSQQQCKEKNSEVCNTQVSKEEVERTFGSNFYLGTAVSLTIEEYRGAGEKGEIICN